MHPLADAHCHYQDPLLAPLRETFLPALRGDGTRAVVNGTRESDWADVAALAAAEAWIVPSYGLHPWHLRERSAAWREALRERLQADPRAAVGEVGLDRWIEGHDLADQLEVLREQVTLAVEFERALTIHCVQAWGALREFVESTPLPTRGFLVHAYGGSWEMVQPLADRGAFFSFSTYFLHPRKAAQREVFARLPLDRLLIETDAPALSPPPEANPRPLSGPAGEPLNDPRNLSVAFEGLAALRPESRVGLAAALEANFKRLFLRDA
ncbi:MAG: TatD family hydrolase [Verrucomicrobia bacterium]|nr:TatD family hydrolase [Verrucomicrobiota bacterium]